MFAATTSGTLVCAEFASAAVADSSAASRRALFQLEPRWQFRTGGVIDFQSPPVVHPSNGLVYIGGYTGVLQAVNGSTGTEVWSVAARDVVAAPMVWEALGMVVFGSSDRHLYSVDALSGKQVPTCRPFHDPLDLRLVYGMFSFRPHVHVCGLP